VADLIQHNFGFPRFVDAADAEVSALYSLCIVVSGRQALSARADARLSRARDDVPSHRRLRDGWRERHSREDHAELRRRGGDGGSGARLEQSFSRSCTTWPAGVCGPPNDYDASVGQVRRTLKQMDGKQPGDPARAARAIIQAVVAENPPLRLPLGQIALEHIRAALDAEARELEPWAHLSATTEFQHRRANQPNQ
jgi:hypothetical protein